jgi:predicted component of type VI protein secretion system
MHYAPRFGIAWKYACKCENKKKKEYSREVWVAQGLSLGYH